MSILIKSMEMPKSCVDCPMFDWDLEYLKCKANGKYFKANGEWRKGIESTCPLIEVPEDVQPVVRCKDCKHFHLDYFGEVNGANIIVAHEICDLWAGGCRTTQNAFCSNGVRADGGA